MTLLEVVAHSKESVTSKIVQKRAFGEHSLVIVRGLLRRQQVKPLLADDPVLRKLITWRETGWVSRLS